MPKLLKNEKSRAPDPEINPQPIDPDTIPSTPEIIPIPIREAPDTDAPEIIPQPEKPSIKPVKQRLK